MFQRGNTLVIKVEENPLINQVNFEGNSKIDDAALAKEVEVRERMIFTKARVRSDTQRVLALYQKIRLLQRARGPQAYSLAGESRQSGF